MEKWKDVTFFSVLQILAIHTPAPPSPPPPPQKKKGKKKDSQCFSCMCGVLSFVLAELMPRGICMSAVCVIH